ncbi:MAG: GNAT family N-acetyltransferase [Bacteroidota bacterium]
MHIRTIKYKEIDQLEGFPPENWHFNLVEFTRFHFGSDYFIPLIAEKGGEIVATGNGIYTGRTGWLGNIIVRPQFRGVGIGKAVTRAVMNKLLDWNCRSLLLIATSEGEALYKKMGWEICGSYLFYECALPVTYSENHMIRMIKKQDHSKIAKLDREITGEERFPLLEKFLDHGLVYDHDGISGFYLPAFGQGLIISREEPGGLELLHRKIGSSKISAVVIPEENQTAREFMENMGIRHHSKANRMCWGEHHNWKPEGVYSRASGYCG